MRRRWPLLILVAGAVVVGALAFARYSQARDSSAWTPQPMATRCPGAPQSSLGLPAITPRNDCTPSFTEQDVRDYVSQGVSLGKIAVIGQPTVTRVTFMTASDASRMLHGEYIGLPDDAIVCYVELSGTFRVDAPFGAHPADSHTAELIFDAHSGNLIITGA